MTEKNLKQAKHNYKELLKEEKNFKKKKEEFFDFILNDSIVQEFLALEGWNYFGSRYYELMQENTVRLYLYLMSKYNNFEEKKDNELVEMAFRNVIQEKDSNNVYVYLGMYTFDDYHKKVEVERKEEASIYEYMNVETELRKSVSIDDVNEFTRENKIVIFKNKRYKPIELFYKYRIMYLRQFLLDNNEILFDNKKLIKSKR